MKKPAYLFAFLGLLTLGMPCPAAEEDPRESEVGVETEPVVAAPPALLVPQGLVGLSIVTPQVMTLTSPDYEVPFTDTLTGLPTLHLGAALPLVRSGALEIQGIGTVGYGYKEGMQQIFMRDGDKRKERLGLHRIPLTGSARILYSIPALPYLKPTLTVGGGVQWLYQTAAGGGLDRGYWVPFYLVSPALTFFESGAAGDWFGGFSFGVSYIDSLGTAQKLRALSFDLNVNVIL